MKSLGFVSHAEFQVFEQSRLPKKKAVDKKLREWAIDIKCRDGRRCMHCSSPSNLHAHHILPKWQFPESKYDLNNGITLCGTCHSKLHTRNLAKGLIGFRSHLTGKK